MQFTKKFDRAFQWAGEKMGQEAKTSMSDDFKSLETEMALRHDGMDRLQKSMNVYVKSVSKRCDASEDKEKGLPIANMGRTMAAHGEDFEPDSEFGNCLIVLGRANEQLASTQEAYVQQATSYWLESLERSLAMMKEYQSARRKLESRRLAYDASTTKVQKAKREDFRLEDELRAAKAKYEESSEDVLRRMQDIKEAEAETVQDLTNFMDAELEYHERCVEELRRARQQWPTGGGSAVPVIRGPRPDVGGGGEPPRRPTARSRSGTAQSAQSYSDRTERWASNGSRQDLYEDEDELEQQQQPAAARAPIRSNGRLSVSGTATPAPVSPPRPGMNRSSTYAGGTFEGPTTTSSARSPSYREPPPLPQDSGMRKANTAPVAPPPNIGSLRGNLRPVSRISTSGGGDVFGDDYDTATSSGSPEYDRSESPATSYGSLSRTTSNVGLQQQQQQPAPQQKKAPPPPPPSRAKKPPPPIPQKSGLIR